jgi:adenosylcobinamide-GDP ribazoletransferase
MNEALRGLAADLKAATLFATRLPLPHAAAIGGSDIARAAWALPAIGALIGLLSALAYWVPCYFRAPPFVCAALAVAASLIATGGLHEDGLADTCDGLGGGTRERKLEIMRDSRVGTYGACSPPMRAHAPRCRCSWRWCRRRGRRDLPPMPAGRRRCAP